MQCDIPRSSFQPDHTSEGRRGDVPLIRSSISEKSLTRGAARGQPFNQAQLGLGDSISLFSNNANLWSFLYLLFIYIP